jgi:hypothetical protein
MTRQGVFTSPRRDAKWLDVARKKTGHGEVDAMRMLEGALEPLESDARGRVLRWAHERFGASMPTPPVSGRPQASAATSPSTMGETPQDAGEFYAQADPQTEPERALVVAYWVQEIRAEGQFEAQAVNTQLKQLGHGVSNITRALDNLKDRKPQLVIQIQKSGKAKQARKRYKVTAAGKAEVKRMLDE